MSIVLRSRKTLAQRYRGVLKKYGTLSHLWDFGVDQGPLAYAASHTAAEFIAAYPLWPLWQDTAGTVPACKINDPIGLCLDQPTGVVTLGPELVTAQSVSGGAIDGVTGVVTYVVGATPLQATKTYKVSAAVTGYSGSGDVGFSGGTFASVAGVTRLSGNGTMAGVVLGAGSVIIMFSRPATNTCNFSNISVREVIGAHAVQTNPIKRPILSGRVNLLTATEDFSSASWTKQTGCTVTPNATTDPLGGSTADRIDWSSTNAGSGLFQPAIATSGNATYKRSVYVKADIAGGTIGIKDPNSTQATATITLKTSWQLLTLSESNGISISGLWVFKTETTPATVYLWGADLRPANSPTNIPAYQRVTSATDYDTVGFPVRALFDGVDDCLVVPSLDLSMTDKVTVVAGVAKLSDAARAMVMELGNTPSAAVFHLSAPNANAEASYGWRSAGTSIVDISTTAYASPVASVVTGIGDISGKVSKIKVNGVVVASSTASQGTGTYALAALNIGQRSASSLPFNGAIQSLAVIGNLLPYGEVQILEAAANAAMGKVY